MTNLTNNKAVLSWIDEMTAITKPDKIVWITGEEEQLGALREQAVKEGILIKLNPDKLPGCYLHRTDPDDVARVEDRTFICCEKEEDAGPTNHWVEPKEMYERMYALADGAYKGRTMYIIPYSMSIIGSPFAKYGFELTDSIYVVLNMHIMTRIGKAVCDALGDDEGFIKGLHCQCNLDKDNKYIVHFPQDNTIISMNSNYGGNVLQGKKCFALRIASFQGKNEGWMAEHMLILGLQNPKGEIKYISAAFPSACGKTNLAMLIPPEGYRNKGYKVEMLVAYENSFAMMNEWFKQLFGESEGKDGKGLFPASATFSTDLHSLGQFIQDGSNILFETVVHIAKAQKDFFLKNDATNGDGLNFLSNQNMSVVNQKAYEGTIIAHTEGGTPNMVLEMPEVNESELGYLIYFFEKACAISGYMLGVNPFNQPGVESYKKNMFALLGKPGYEDQKAALEARLG